jgi:hypothetical protein
MPYPVVTDRHLIEDLEFIAVRIRDFVRKNEVK